MPASIPAIFCCAGKRRSGPTKPPSNFRGASPKREPIFSSRPWPAFARGPFSPEPQNNSLATYAPILKKEDGRIDWSNPAQQIHDLIRGFQPWPGAHTSFRGQSLHLWRSRLVCSMFRKRWNLPPGALVHERGVFAIGGDGAALELLELQLEGRKKMPAEVFANGHHLTSTDRLGA